MGAMGQIVTRGVNNTKPPKRTVDQAALEPDKFLFENCLFFRSDFDDDLHVKAAASLPPGSIICNDPYYYYRFITNTVLAIAVIRRNIIWLWTHDLKRGSIDLSSKLPLARGTDAVKYLATSQQ